MEFNKGDRVKYTGNSIIACDAGRIGKIGTVLSRQPSRASRREEVYEVKWDDGVVKTAHYGGNLELLPEYSLLSEYSAITDPEVNVALRDEVAMRCFAEEIQVAPKTEYERLAKEAYNAAEAFIAERNRRYGKEK